MLQRAVAGIALQCRPRSDDRSALASGDNWHRAKPKCDHLQPCPNSRCKLLGRRSRVDRPADAPGRLRRRTRVTHGRELPRRTLSGSVVKVSRVKVHDEGVWEIAVTSIWTSVNVQPGFSYLQAPYSCNQFRGSLRGSIRHCRCLQRQRRGFRYWSRRQLSSWQ